MNKSLHVLLTQEQIAQHPAASNIALWSGRYTAPFARGILSVQYITVVKSRYTYSKIFFLQSFMSWKILSLWKLIWCTTKSIYSSKKFLFLHQLSFH